MTTSLPLPVPAAKPIDPGKLALVKAYCADAEKLLLEDRFHEARKVVQQALRLAPSYAAAVHILGVIEMESGNLEEAARLIKRTTELEPNVHDPFYFLGLTYVSLGRLEEAAAAFEAALALKPDLRTVLRQLAETLEILGRNDEARSGHLSPAGAGSSGLWCSLPARAPRSQRCQRGGSSQAGSGGRRRLCTGGKRSRLDRAGGYLRSRGRRGQGLPASEARQ